MNWTLQPRRHWSGFGPTEGNGLSRGEFAAIGAESSRWALLIIAVGAVAAYLWLGG
jgi:hypothetical protein